jgi:hypothetical protein
MNLSIVKILRWLWIIPVLFAEAQLSSTSTVETFPIPSDRSRFTVTLSKNFIVASSIHLSAQRRTVTSFIFDKQQNLLTVDLDSSSSDTDELSVTYTFLPLTLRRSYSSRSIVFRNDSLDKKRPKAIVTQNEGVFTNMFGPELNKSGSISRGFIVGSNRDLTLSSGFRLQLSGKLSDEIDILAALTDENTPLQPQGNTQTLQEIDNVFVQIKSPVYTATLGDFQFSAKSGEFVNINRKLQGAEIVADYRNGSPQSNIQITGATSRGKFNSNSFQGIEGVQGPYRLTGKNNERAIIIIAGSEKVYVDGVLMLRGDNNDYSIEYGSAEVTFSTRRLITGASRIVIDFEFSDRQYTRNFIGFNTATSLSDIVTFRANYFREADDPDAPIDIALSESDKELLRSSGNAAASKSGVIVVGTDSLGIGKGNYLSVDTLIDGISRTIYRYEPNTSLSILNVAFSSVGQGNGDYQRESVGRYRFVGIGAGQYAPVVILPAPQSHQLYSMQTTIRPLNELTVNAEYAASSFDGNRFSSLGNGAMDGGAFSLQARYHPVNVNVGGWNIGEVELSLSERFKQDRFLSFDRTDLVEFGRKWSTDSLTQGPSSDEEVREASIRYAPVRTITIASSAGTLERTGQFSSRRYDGSIALNDSSLPKLSYYAETIKGDDLINSRTNEWFRQKGSAEYGMFGVTPSLRFEQEKRRITNTNNDSLDLSSYSFLAYSPKISAEDVLGVDLSSEVEFRNDDAVVNGTLIPQSNSLTQNYSAAIREVRNFSFSSLFTFREKRYEKTFQSGNTNQQTTLVKLQSRYRPFAQGLDIDLMYDAATQRTAKLERYFYKVRKGEGQYIWFDANNNGVADLNDEREFRPDRYDGEYLAVTLNSDALIPIINLKASSRVRITPSRFILRPESAVEKILSVLSAETFIRIEERSTEPSISRIYLLNMGSFLNRLTTQLGTQFVQQDLFLFEVDPEYSFRFRFNQRRSLSQFASGLEQNFGRERSLRARFQLSDDLSNQTDLILKDDNAVSSSAINRSRTIGSTALSTDLSYRPEKNIEIGIQFETSQSMDHSPKEPVQSDYNGQTLRLVYGFLGNGQIRSEVSREEILISNNGSGYTVPYELTAGRDLGKNFLWSTGAEYRLAGNIQFSLQYSGRTTSRSDVVHTGRMEIRAFF